MNQTLKRDFGSIVAIDPFRCRVWALNGRVEEHVTEESCRAEIESVQRDGQLVPVIGRTLKDSPDFDIEVVCGARRLFIARHLRISIRVEVRDLTDREAAVAVEAENSLRKQTSPYERGMWLASLLRQKVYSSRDEMGRGLHITPTQVTRLLKFADLPAPIIGAFASPHDILESWAVELHKACNDERRDLLNGRARLVGTRAPRPPAVSIYETLLAPRKSVGRSRSGRSSRLVKSPAGKPLFRFERQRTEVVLRIPNGLVSPTVEEEVTQAVMAVLTRPRSGQKAEKPNHAS